MNEKQNSKLKSANKFIAPFLKLGIFLLLIWSIYHKLQSENFYQLTTTFWLNFNSTNLIWLIFGILLMPLNWGIEAFKWKLLISKIEDINWWTSLQAICAGITLAMFTPNRIGEFGGRVLLLKNASRIEGIAITLIGSFSQIVASFSIGLLGWIFFYTNFLTNDSSLIFALTGLSILSAIALFLLYYNLEWVKKILDKLPFSKKTKSYFNPIVKYSILELSTFLALSASRFVIFSFQYCLFFWALGINIDLPTALMLIFSIFFVQTIIPSIAIVELGIRGKVALYFMDFVKANSLAVLTAAFGLWMVNLLFPAFIGFLVLLRKKNFVE